MKCLDCGCHAVPRRQERSDTSVFDMHLRLIFGKIDVYKAAIKGLARHVCVKKLADDSQTLCVFLFTAWELFLKAMLSQCVAHDARFYAIRHNNASCLVPASHALLLCSIYVIVSLLQLCEHTSL